MSWHPVPFERTQWIPLNSPNSPEFSNDGKQLKLKTNQGDYWRVPFPPPGRDSSDGGMMCFRRKVGKEGFEVRCKLEVKPEEKFDQAALFVQLSPTEWVKAGAEFDHGKIWHGVVVCNPFSDWSIQPPHPSSTFTISFHPQTTTLRVFLGSGTDEIMIRECKTFGLRSAAMLDLKPGQVSESEKPEEILGELEVTIGCMACSPKGGGAECIFSDFEMKDGAREME